MHSAIWVARGLLAPSGEGWFAAQLDGDCRLVQRGKSLALSVPLLLWCGQLWCCFEHCASLSFYNFYITGVSFSTFSTSQGCHFLPILHHRDAVLVSWTQTHLQAPTLAMALQVRPLIVHRDIWPIFVLFFYMMVQFFFHLKDIQSIFHNPGDAHSSPPALGRQPARQLWTTTTRLAGVGDQQTWVLKGSVLEKKHPSFLLMPNFHKLQDDSKNVSLKIGS